MKVLMTIAGSDPSGGAGIQADLATFAAHGHHGTSATTAITVQNTIGVARVVPVDAATVGLQIEALLEDFDIAAIKVGMLANAGIVAQVAAVLNRCRPRVIIDPVITSSSGHRLLDDDGVQLLIQELLPRAFAVTPNLSEASVLAGFAVSSPEEMKAAAESIAAAGAENVVVTGGHAEFAPATDGALHDGTWRWFSGEVLAGPDVRGTGCVFASALACGAADHDHFFDAVADAKAFTADFIRGAQPLGKGRRIGTPAKKRGR